MPSPTVKRNETFEKKSSSNTSRPRDLWLHIRLLYVLFALLSIICASMAFVGYNQVTMLRRDFEGEILPRGVVEFSDRGHGGVRLTLREVEPDQTSELSRDTEEEQLIRVRRETGLHGPDTPEGERWANEHGDQKQSGPFFYGGRTYRDGEGEEGSGTDEWVWLTSYSRIPIFALQDFCAATRDYCPPGAMGPTGMPGIKGDRGEIGYTGLPGEPGRAGSHGKDGLKGEKGDSGTHGHNGTRGPVGQKGKKGDRGLAAFPGYQDEEGYPTQCIQCPPGPPGMSGKDGLPGMPGDPGYNGTAGRRGRRGHPGKDGAPGPKGDMGLSAPKGEKGDRGIVGPPGAPGLDGMAALQNCTCRKGEAGEKGDKGQRGLIGFIGYKGEPGESGPAGSPGPIMEGIPGPIGPTGPPGLRGPKGEKGEAGRPFVTGSNLRLDPTIATTVATTIPTTTTPEPIISPRQVDCNIRMIGKPVFQRYTGTFWGAWMRDSRPPVPSSNKYWFTRHFTGNVLYEYDTFEEFRRDHVAKTYSLTELYFGTGHVVYAGSFYYQRAGNNELIKYDLSQGRTVAKTSLWQAAYQSKDYVYSTEYNYFDLAVDENGLWAIYGAESEPWTLLVSKILPTDLTVEKTWNITVQHQRYGNGFITCGVLYLIKDTQAKATVIDFAYDLYTKENLAVRLKFTNPFQMNNMVTYNPSDNKLYCWDKGNQLIYPLLL